jgi:hypothetical protein
LEVAALSEDASNMGLLQARAKLESSTLVPIDMDSEVALGIASHHRLDWMNNRASVVDVWRLIEFNANALEAGVDFVFSGDINTLGDNPFRFRSTTGRLRVGLQFDAPITRLAERNLYRQALIEYQQRKRSYIAFIDNVSGTLRNILRQIELNQVNFEMRRAAVRIALDQVELARLRLQEPPRPGVAAAFGSTTARDLVSALSDLLAVQNDYLSVWTNYEQQRMVLDFNLGTFQLDERGMWIDPGSIDNDTYGGTCDEPIDYVDPSEPPELLPPLAGHEADEEPIEPRDIETILISPATGPAADIGQRNQEVLARKPKSAGSTAGRQGVPPKPPAASASTAKPEAKSEPAHLNPELSDDAQPVPTLKIIEPQSWQAPQAQPKSDGWRPAK